MIVTLDYLSDKRGVLAHGCFDLLHIGHIRHLQEARLMHWPLSPLVVTITADRFIAKGDGRPAFDQDTRAEWLDALRVVDFVAIVDEPTAVTAINIIKPNVFVKGQEYQTGILKAEVDAVMKHGGIITHTRERPSGISSTAILSGEYLRHRLLERSFVECWEQPYILDTEDKVRWANTVLFFGNNWELGDSCWYRPKVPA